MEIKVLNYIKSNTAAFIYETKILKFKKKKFCTRIPQGYHNEVCKFQIIKKI